MWALTSQLVSPYLLLMSTPVLAAPFPKILSRPPTNMTCLQARDRYILRNDTLSGQLIAINPNTLQPVPQGLSTDGSGQGFNAPAVIWIVLVLAIGVPLSFAGLRGLRLTSGVGVGLVVILPGKPAFFDLPLISWLKIYLSMGVVRQYHGGGGNIRSIAYIALPCNVRCRIHFRVFRNWQVDRDGVARNIRRFESGYPSYVI